MCIAIPMKILSIDEHKRTGRALYSGNEMDVNISLVSPKTGDYVLVHAGCAIEIIRKKAAEKTLKLLEEINEGQY